MELALVFSALVFFAAGLGVGLWVRRQAGRTAVLEAQQASERERGTLAEQVRARDEQVRELRAELQSLSAGADRAQARLVELTGDLAHARAQAEQARNSRPRWSWRPPPPIGSRPTSARRRSAAPS